MSKFTSLFMTASVFFAAQAMATASVPSLNNCPDMIFIDGNESDSESSGGFIGAYPGSFTRTIDSDNTFYYYVPSSYQPTEAIPIMVVWHGTAGAGNAPAAAIGMRNYWQSEAELYGFIVVAQVATGNSGSWIPSPDSGRLSDIFYDMQNRYNIETTRRYVWGFSAGGHVLHAIALNNANYFAAYAVSAGVLEAYASGQGFVPANADRTIPVYVSIGNSDSLLPFAQDDQLDFIGAGWQVNSNYWLEIFSGGHVLPDDVPTKAWNKICISTALD